MPQVPPPLRWTFQALERLSPRLAGRAAGELFLRPRRHRRPEREREVLEGAERHPLTTERGPALAWVWGRLTPASARVPTLFLVHGWEGRGGQLGAFVAPLRAAGFRVVSVEAPGHGEAPGSTSSLVAIGAALEAAAERWGPAVGVIAHSAGAVGTTFALARGLEAERVVFVAPGANLRGYTGLFARLLGLGEASRRHLERGIERRIGIAFDELEPLRRAPEMTHPLLVLSDRDDRETPLEQSRRLVEAWPGARLEATEGLGHRRILRDPRVVARAVEFLCQPASGAGDGRGEEA